MNLKIIFFVTILFVSCSDNDDSQKLASLIENCDTQRELYEEVENVQATISYFDNHELYALIYAPDTGGVQNIDSVIYALPCELDNRFKEIGTEVVFSGSIELLTDIEKELFGPVPAGTEVYVLKISSIELTQ